MAPTTDKTADKRVLRPGFSIGFGRKNFRGGTRLVDIPEHIIKNFSPERIENMFHIPEEKSEADGKASEPVTSTPETAAEKKKRLASQTDSGGSSDQ